MTRRRQHVGQFPPPFVRPVRTVAVLAGLAESLLAGTGCTALGPVPAYDTAPVDWAAERKMLVPGLPRATAAEPFAAGFSARRAETFLDDVAVRWTRHNKCGSCHTNISYLMARPQSDSGKPIAAVAEVRSSLLAFADETWRGNSDLKTFMLAPIAGALSINDGLSGTAPDLQLLQLLDRLWSVQDPRGGWYYHTNETLVPFLERNRYYTSLLVAVGAGYIAGRYEATPLRREGLARLTAFLHREMPDNLHERAVLLWGSARTPGLLAPPERASIRRALLAKQNRDGGWTLAGLGTWPRHDGVGSGEHGPSDSYATALAALALCESGSAGGDRPIERARGWLATHQRQSGRWYMRSTFSDRFDNYISNMATSYALMARRSCARRSVGAT